MSADRHHDKRLMAYSAAVMFGGAVAINLVESVLPGGQSFSLLPGFGALAFVILVLTFGPRLPRLALGAMGPLGVAMIAYALASTDLPGDGAILYTWPVLWQAYFFGRRGTVLILASVGLAHGVALAAIGGGADSVDRWIDVIATVTIIGLVVEMLAARNRELVDQISAEARVDELTGILNRRGFDERAATEIARARRDGTSVAVVTFDLDFFKQVNDEFGHEAGDRVLVGFAKRLGEEMRDTDVVGRLGGEEFMALLPGADLEQAKESAERVRTALLTVPEPDAPRVTVSAGVAARRAPDRLETLLKAADMALYAAKSQGRNRTAVERGEVDGEPPARSQRTSPDRDRGLGGRSSLPARPDC